MGFMWPWLMMSSTERPCKQSDSTSGLSTARWVHVVLVDDAQHLPALQTTHELQLVQAAGSWVAQFL